MNHESVTIENLVHRARVLGLGDIADTWMQQGTAEKPVEIIILGEFNHGKSSLLNAVFGENVLPFGITPTTQIDTVVSFGASERRVEAFSANRCVLAWGWDEWKTLNHNAIMASLKTQSVDRIHIQLETNPWPGDCIFMDTPGLNEAIFARESFIKKYFAHADILIFVLDANQPLTGNEQKLLAEITNHFQDSQRILIVNKCDRLDDEEKLDVCHYVETTLFPSIKNERIYMVSAKKKNTGDWQELMGHLQNEIAFQKENLVKSSLEKRLSEMNRQLESFVILFNQLRHLPRAELKQVIQDNGAVSVSSEDVAYVIRELNHELVRMKEQVVRDIELFKLDFLKAMPREIDIAQMDAAEKYFEDFIDERFSKFSDDCMKRLAPFFEHINSIIVERLTRCRALSVPAVSTLGAVEYYKKHASPTGAFDDTGRFSGWSLPLPGMIASRIERPRRETLKKMAAEAIGRRAAGYTEVFTESLNEWIDRLTSLICEHGMLLAGYIRQMGRTVCANDYTFEDWME